MKLGNGVIEALESLVGSKSEGNWHISWLSSGVGNDSSILELGNVMNGSPVSNSAVLVISLLDDVDSDS